MIQNRRYLLLGTATMRADKLSNARAHSVSAAIIEPTRLQSGSLLPDSPALTTITPGRRSSDKLSAISAIAKRFQSAINGPYLVGIWKASFPYGLV